MATGIRRDLQAVVIEKSSKEGLPPSAKLVLKVLEYNEELTQKELVQETLLPSRTVRYALSRLESARLVKVRFSTLDARKRIYSIKI